MTFLLPLALALGLLIGVPILAHARRSGTPRPLAFPAARLVQATLSTAKQRSFLEDRFLLTLRALLLVALALLGASPLVRCSRLSLARSGGGSLAVALVVDDSASMRALGEKSTRLEQSVQAALEMLDSSRDGDMFVLVLAGAPARLVVPATSNRESIRSALKSITPTDRTTDVVGAVHLGQSSLLGLPQPNHQVVLFTDAADQRLSPTDEALGHVLLPLPDLQRPFENCGLINAELRGHQVNVEAACTSDARGDRDVFLSAANPKKLTPEPFGEVLAQAKLSSGTARLMLPNDKNPKSFGRLVVELGPDSNDQIAADDAINVASPTNSLVIAVLSDRARAGVETSERTVVELGLDALESGERVRPLTSLPDSKEGLAQFSALIVDDPPGFTPEVQNALEAWVTEGGVLLTLLGPRAEEAPLSAGFWPITRGAPRFLRLDPSRGDPLPSETGDAELIEGFQGLKTRFHSVFDLPEETRTLVALGDGSPLLSERTLGLGVLLTAHLPASVDLSDFALRPGFLELLDRTQRLAESRSMTGRSRPGSTWVLPKGTTVRGPRGPMTVVRSAESEPQVSPDLAGIYEIVSGQRTLERLVGRDPLETIAQPQTLASGVAPTGSSTAEQWSGISREIALLVLTLATLELFFRARRRPLTPEPAIERG